VNKAAFDYFFHFCGVVTLVSACEPVCRIGVRGCNEGVECVCI